MLALAIISALIHVVIKYLYVYRYLIIFILGMIAYAKSQKSPQRINCSKQIPSQSYYHRQYYQRPEPKRTSYTYRTDANNRQLQSRLLTLLKGDSATAKRLLLNQRRRNPGMSDNWYLEKVIHDIERDHRSY